ncbi:hypothetical protein QQ045_023233 [Rhodiola kirilowii]
MTATAVPPPMVSLTEMSTSISELNQIHAHMLKTSLIHHNFPASRLISAIVADPQNLHYAHSILTHAHTPNSYMYNAVIRGYANGPDPRSSVGLMCEMLSSAADVVPDRYTYTFALKGCASFEGIEEGQQVHGHVVKLGIGFDVYVKNTLIHLYAKCGRFGAARQLLDEMVERDVISWNAILSAYVELGMMDCARKLFDEMGERNLESWNFMISGYVGVGLVEEARAVFDDMPVKNVVSWNSMITGYARDNRFDQVLCLFEDMQNAGMKADDITFVNVLSACARIGALSQGEWVHAYIKKSGRKVAGFLGTALVDMYSKCGKIENALEAFENTSRKDISTWNSIISGLSLHGHGEHALHIFSRMLSDGVEPNEVTFISLLSACSRSGLVEKGLEMFDSMVKAHGIKPTVEHYGCMIDMLGRFGKLKEAEELMGTMPFEAPVVYESLLAACRNHGNTRLAEVIGSNLLKMKPRSCTGYVQLSNVYASQGRWDDVANIRIQMRERGATKEPGCSMIEVDGHVHEFWAGEGMILE